MPYATRKRGDKFVNINTETGDVKGTFASKEKAQKQLNLLQGIKHGWVPTGAKAKGKSTGREKR